MPRSFRCPQPLGGCGVSASFLLRSRLGPADEAGTRRSPPLERSELHCEPPTELLRQALARGAAGGLALLRGPDAPPWGVLPGAMAVGTLGEYPAGAVRCSEDMLATVLLPLCPAPALTGLVAFEPKEALHLVRDRLGEGPWAAPLALGAVREAGAAILQGAFAGVASPGAQASGAARLEEDALAATLLRTHAPREAALLSLELFVGGEDVALRAVLLALAEAKGLASLLTLAEPGA